MNIGVISVSMCKHVMKAADKLRIFNRTKEKSEPLIEVGAEFIESRELSEKRDAVFLMFGYPKDVEQVLLRVQGILQQDKKNKIYMQKGTQLIDHTTSLPELVERIFKEVSKRGIDSIDGSVSGGDVGGAHEGQLVIMCGGQQKALDRIIEALKVHS